MAKRAKRRVRRTHQELFIDQLRGLSGDAANDAVSNAALIEALGWDKEKYDRIKLQLEAANQITRRRGRGGSVILVDDPSADALKVFVSYSHADEEITKALLKHIEPLKKLNLIESWHDRKLKAGEKWADKISEHLTGADIVLLIVSIDFINSDYCYNIELEQALEQHEADKSRVIPIIARSCMWKSAPFSKLQALPKDGKPIQQWTDQDDALTSIAEGIELVARELLSSR